MASTFKIVQSGVVPAIEPKWKVTNNMVNPPYHIQSFTFWFNNGETIFISGGGGLDYGSSRTGSIVGIKSSSNFPLVITSYRLQYNTTTGMDYSVNIPNYTYFDYQQGKVLEISINSYI